MATVLNQQASSVSLGASVTSYLSLSGNSQASGDTSEAWFASIWRSAGTLRNLYINILTNNRGASTFRTRKGTANANLVVSIIASGTGKFEDIVNTDTVTAGDNWHASIVTGAGGTVFTYIVRQVLFAATVNTVHRIGCGISVYGTASTTAYGAFFGVATNPLTITEDNVEETFRTAGTLRNLYSYIRSNTRTTTTTYKSRKNGLNGNMTFDVLGSATGAHEDTTNSDTIAVGDTVNWSVTTGTGVNSITAQGISVEFETTNSQFHPVCGVDAGFLLDANITTYPPLAGSLVSNTIEANVLSEANVVFKSSLLQCYISANGISADSTLRLRKNSANGNQVVSILASQTGVFQDTLNTDSIIASDTLNYSIVTGATGTDLTFRSISILGAPSVIIETLDITIISSSELVESYSPQVETLDFIIISSATTGETFSAIQNLDFIIISSATIIELLGLVETLDFIIISSATTGETFSAIQNLDFIIISLGSLVERYSPQIEILSDTFITSGLLIEFQLTGSLSLFIDAEGQLEVIEDFLGFVEMVPSGVTWNEMSPAVQGWTEEAPGSQIWTEKPFHE